MPHATTANGNIFLTPMILKGEGKTAMIVNTASSDLALKIAYIMEAGAFSGPKDSRFTNKVTREAAHTVADALNGTGKPSDTFAYALPADVANRNNFDSSLWVITLQASREHILTICEAVKKVDSVMLQAESEAGKIQADTLPNVAVKSVNPAPVYETGKVGKSRGGKAGIKV